jgi:hypothetical protein
VSQRIHFPFLQKVPVYKNTIKNSMRLKPIEHNGHRLRIFEACLPYIIPTKYLFLDLNTAKMYYQNRHKEQTLAWTGHDGSRDNFLKLYSEVSGLYLFFVTFLGSQNATILSQLGHNRFLLNPFHFIIHHHPNIRCYIR